MTPSTTDAERVAPASAGSLDAPEALFQLPGDARELVRFPWRAVQRHRTLALRVAVAVLAATAVAAFTTPRQYVIETKMIAERNVVLPALGNPRRSPTLENDAPTRLAAEAVLKRANLEKLMAATDLMSTWGSVRSLPGRVADLLRRITGRSLPEAERRQAMVGLLTQRIWVKTDEGTIVIGVNWSTADAAYRLVQAAQQNFIEERQRTELGMIEESIAILQQHSVSAEVTMEAALQGLRRGASAHRGPVSAVPRSLSLPPDAALAAVQGGLLDKQRAIAQLENQRAARKQALESKLQDLQRSYGPAHPEVLAARETYAAFLRDTADLRVQHEEEAVLLARLRRLSPGAGVDAAAAQSLRTTAPEVRSRGVDTLTDPDVIYATSRLKMATNEYEDLLDRLQSARIEQETARAAFKYRFTIVTPPELPKRPTKPNLLVLLGGGVLLALLLATVVAVALDLQGGLVLERWQVRRQLGLPLLADLGERT